MGFSYGTVHTDTWFTNIIDVFFFSMVSFIISLLFFKGIYKMERYIKFLLHHTITYGGLIGQFICIQTFEISILTLGFTQLPIILEKIVFFIFHLAVCNIWLFLSWSILKRRNHQLPKSFWIIQILIVFCVAINALLNLIPSFFNHSDRIFPYDIPSIIFNV